jgi:hypothetical protein
VALQKSTVQTEHHGLGVDGSRFVIVRGSQNPVKGAFGVGFAADP